MILETCLEYIFSDYSTLSDSTILQKNYINLNLAFYPLTAVNRGTRW